MHFGTELSKKISLVNTWNMRKWLFCNDDGLRSIQANDWKLAIGKLEIAGYLLNTEAMFFTKDCAEF